MSATVHEFKVAEQSRIDVYITGQLTAYSRSKVQKLIFDGHATVNDLLIMESRYQVNPGDTVRFVEPEPDPDFPIQEKVPLNVIYEDDYLLVIDKSVGMVTHPNTFHDTGTLVQAVLARYPKVKEALYDPDSAISRLRPGIVHRLDKDTSGLIVVAKTREVMLNLTEQFHKRQVEKEYETVLYGALLEPRTIDAPIHRKGGGSSNLMVASHESGQGRTAVTHFTPIETSAPYAKWPEEKVTKVRVKIETGRTHQIRVHAKFIGHPVLGDPLYANKPSHRLSEKLGLTTQQLRAVFLQFKHPQTGIMMSITAPEQA